MAKHKKAPLRKYTITSDNKKITIRSRQFAHQVAKDEFFDITQGGEIISEYHIRFLSPRWGIIDVTWEDA